MFGVGKGCMANLGVVRFGIPFRCALCRLFGEKGTAELLKGGGFDCEVEVDVFVIFV